MGLSPRESKQEPNRIPPDIARNAIRQTHQDIYDIKGSRYKTGSPYASMFTTPT